MNWKETRHLVANDNEAKAMSYVDALSPEGARQYATRLFELRCRGWGNKASALDDVATLSRMSPRSFERVMNGETKEPKVGVVRRIRSAYLAYCAKLAKRLQHEIEIEMRTNGDAALEDIGDEVLVLVEKIEAAKERIV